MEPSHYLRTPLKLATESNHNYGFHPKGEDPMIFSLDDKIPLHHYKKKQTIYYEGHPALGIYFVFSGSVKVYKIAANGKPHILFIANRGDFLEIESVLAGEEFSSSAEMLEDGMIRFIDRQRFFDLAHENPQFSLKLTDSLAKRVKNGDEERVNLAEGSVRERFARALALLARSYGVAVKQGILINLKLSREDLANIVGTAVGTALRLLKEFKEDDVILLEKKQIIIQDQKSLEEVAHLS